PEPQVPLPALPQSLTHTPPALQVGVPPPQAAHSAPPEPHCALFDVPARHVVPSQQPPLHCPAALQENVHVLPLQALVLAQSVRATQPASVPTVHIVKHTLPLHANRVPHATGDDTHMVDEHVTSVSVDAIPAVVQVEAGQSAVVLQPHMPVVFTQACPDG